MRYILFLLLLVPPLFSHGSDKNLKSYTLKYRDPKTLISIIKEMTDDDKIAIKAFDDKLIINAPVEEQQIIAAILQELDTPQKQLLIYVAQTNNSLNQELGFSSCGVVKAKTSTLALNCAEELPNVNIVANTHRNKDALYQTLQVVDGGIAHIQTGTEIPIVNKSMINGSLEYSITYKPVLSGFYVQPIVLGEHVSINISANREALARTNAGVIESNSLTTTINAPLNKWLQVGGNSSNQQARSHEITYHTSERDKSNQQLWIRIKVAE